MNTKELSRDMNIDPIKGNKQVLTFIKYQNRMNKKNCPHTCNTMKIFLSPKNIV